MNGAKKRTTTINLLLHLAKNDVLAAVGFSPFIFIVFDWIKYNLPAIILYHIRSS